MDRLEPFWADIEDCCVKTGNRRAITDRDLTGLITDRFGVSASTIHGYKDVLKRLGWIAPVNSGDLYILTRRQGKKKKLKGSQAK
jgi:hypothetical protein